MLAAAELQDNVNGVIGCDFVCADGGIVEKRAAPEDEPQLAHIDAHLLAKLGLELQNSCARLDFNRGLFSIDALDNHLDLSHHTNLPHTPHKQSQRYRR